MILEFLLCKPSTHIHTYAVGVGRCHSYRFVCWCGQWTHMCRMHYEWRNAVSLIENKSKREKACDMPHEIVKGKEWYIEIEHFLCIEPKILCIPCGSHTHPIFCPIMCVWVHCVLCVICMQAINSHSRIKAYQCFPAHGKQSFYYSRGQFFTHRHDVMYMYIVKITAKTKQIKKQEKNYYCSQNQIHKKLSWRHPCSISTNYIRSPQYSALLPHFFCMATCYLRFETFFVLLNRNWSLSSNCIIVVVILVSYCTESYAYIIHVCMHVVCTAETLFSHHKIYFHLNHQHMNRKFAWTVHTFVVDV